MRIRSLCLNKGTRLNLLIRVRILHKTLFHKGFQKDSPTGSRNKEKIIQLGRDQNGVSRFQ